jgi:hypothetical protein
MALALSSTEMVVLRATDTKTISRSATSAAPMSNHPVSLNHLISNKKTKAPKLTVVKTAAGLVLLAVDAQLDLAVDDPAVFAAEDVEVHGRRVAAQLSSTADRPFGDGTAYVVLWETSSVDEQTRYEVSYFVWSRIY